MPHTHDLTTNQRRRLLGVFSLTLGLLVIEVIGGLAANSLALLADAGHLLTDLVGMGLALLAIWVGARRADAGRTFGYRRLEILSVVLNALLLFGVGGVILFEALHRLLEPPSVASGLMVAVALVGLLVNGISLRLLHVAQAHNLNARGAYLEVLGDFAGAGAVLLAGVVIIFTGFTRADALASAFIALLIVPRTWSLLHDALDILLEATPKDIDMGQVRAHILEAPGVISVHDLHAWSISSGLNVVSAHVLVESGREHDVVLDHLCRCLADIFDVEHSTFQIETADRLPFEEIRHT